MKSPCDIKPPVFKSQSRLSTNHSNSSWHVTIQKRKKKIGSILIVFHELTSLFIYTKKLRLYILKSFKINVQIKLYP